MTSSQAGSGRFRIRAAGPSAIPGFQPAEPAVVRESAAAPAGADCVVEGRKARAGDCRRQSGRPARTECRVRVSAPALGAGGRGSSPCSPTMVSWSMWYDTGLKIPGTRFERGGDHEAGRQRGWPSRHLAGCPPHGVFVQRQDARLPTWLCGFKSRALLQAPLAHPARATGS